MAEERVRRGLLLRTVMEILRDAGTKLSQQELDAELGRRVAADSHELSVDKSGLPRYERAVGFHTGDAATVGWMSKIGGWSITEAGMEALDTYRSPMSCGQSFAGGCGRSTASASRLKATLARCSSSSHQRSRSWSLAGGPLTMISPDWPELPRTRSRTSSPASSSAANAYRVLNADGSIPDEGMLNFAYRGVDLHKRLASEGIEFDADGRAAQRQRLDGRGSERTAGRARKCRRRSTAPARSGHGWSAGPVSTGSTLSRNGSAKALSRSAPRSSASLDPDACLRRAETGSGDRLPAQVLRLPRAAA